MFYLTINRGASASLSVQLREQLVAHILERRLSPGEKMPSTRALAKDLGVSRNCVMEVYEELIAEGFLDSREGSGTYVMPDLPVAALRRIRSFPTVEPSPAPTIKDDLVRFAVGLPDFEAFPKAKWALCLRRACFGESVAQWSYPDLRGDPGLRQQIVRHLLKTKNIHCSAEQIATFSGAAQAVHLLAHLFLKIKDSIVVEDPVLGSFPRLFKAVGHKVSAIPVHADGIDPRDLGSSAKYSLAMLGVSHQFPTGVSMPIRRRVEWVEWAREKDAFILEDDYDGEFRFAGPPIRSTHSLAPQRVIHMGTFSKTMFPGMRLAYLVTPPDLIPSVIELKDHLFMRTSSLMEATMFAFMARGEFSAHVERMKRRYRRKMRLLCEKLESAFDSQVEISGKTQGLHIVARFPGIEFNRTQRAFIASQGVELDYFDDYLINGAGLRGKVVLGFGNLGFDDIQVNVDRLAQTLAQV